MTAPNRPTQELLPWLFPLSDGIVVCKDSSFLATFEFEGVDGNATTMHELTSLLEHLDAGLKLLAAADRPLSVWWTVHRRRTGHYPETKKWSSPVSEEIDEIHKDRFFRESNFINRHYISLVFHPQTGTNKLMDRVSSYTMDGVNPVMALIKGAKTVLSSEASFAWAEDQLDYELMRVEGLLDTFAGSLSALGLRRLVWEDFHGFLAACASPDWDGRPAKIIQRDRMEWFMDSMLGNNEIEVGHDMLRLTGGAKARYVGGVAVKKWPEYTNAGAMDGILSLPYELTVSHVFRYAGKAETEKQISSTKRFNDLLKYGLKSWVVGAFSQSMAQSSANPARVEASEECNEALGELTAGRLVFGWQNSAVIVYADTEDKLKEGTDEVFRTFADIGIPGAVRETIHLLSAWVTTMPGQWRECKRWALLSSENMEDMAPVQTILRGEEQNNYLAEQTGRKFPALTVLSTDYATPYYFNFHHGALGHAMVVGPSRSGKSVFMNFLISQWQKYEPCRTIIFDKDYSCKIATLTQGGEHIDLAETADSIKINPMSLVGDSKHWSFLSKWIDGLICSKGYSTDAEDERAIREAVEDVASDPEQEHWRLLTVYTLLPERLKLQLEPWVGDGHLARYFDNVEDTFSLGNFSCIEMGYILREKRVARSFMDYAFYRIQGMMEQNRQGNPIPTFIYLEECWFLLEDPFFAERIRDWLKTMAKMLCHVVMATQSLEDIVESDSKVFSSMRDNVLTYIFLPNSKAKMDSLSRLYRREFELSDEQIDVIYRATPQAQYFIKKPGVARVVSCRFSPRQLAVLRSDARAQSLFNRHASSGAADWVNNYIEEVSYG